MLCGTLAHVTPAPSDRITYIGRTTHRNSGTLFGIRQRDRRMHILCCGKSGTGKSHLLKSLIAQDIRAGGAFALFDPHGDLALSIRELVIANGSAAPIYLDPGDPRSEWRFNPFAHVPPENHALAAAGVVEVFKKLWADDWGPRLEHLLRNVAFTLLETPESTFGDVPTLLNDRSFRQSVARDLENSVVRTFWLEEFDKYSAPFRATVTAPLHNKVGALLTDPTLRRFFTAQGTFLNLREVMDGGRILIVNLDKGRLGENGTNLIGSLLLSHIGLTGLARSGQAERERRDFAVFVDEFYSFTTLSLANMLAEMRKFAVSLVLSQQHLSQVDQAVRDAVFGNVGTIIAFRVGATDGAFLAREFAAAFSAGDLTGLERYNICIRLLIDGQPSRPFSASTLDDVDIALILSETSATIESQEGV
jgi:hypothetical protein